MSLAHLNAPSEEAIICLRENEHPFPGLFKGKVTV